MLMTRNLDPVQNFKQILLNSCPNNEITKNRLKNDLNLTSPQQNQGRGTSNTVSSPHSVNFNMIYEQNGAAPAVNCPTASNFQLKVFYFFDCNGLEEDHKAAKLIFHWHMMFQGRQSQKKTTRLISDVLLMVIEVRHFSAYALSSGSLTSFWLYLMASLSRLRFMRSSSRPLLST